MRKRPLCLVFLGLIVIITILDMCGWTIGVPDDVYTAADDMKSYDGGCIVSGLISDRNKTEKGYTYTLRDAVLKRRGKEFHLGGVRVNSTSEKITVGTGVRIYGKLSFYEPASNPGGFDARRYYLGDKIYSSISMRYFTVISEPGRILPNELFAALREKISDRLSEIMGEKAGGILSAMATGDRSSIDEETRINYSVSGLSHLLAISGLHIGIIGAALLSVLLIIGVPRIPASLFSMLFLFVYCMFTGSRESTIRAFVMFTVAAAAVLLRKSYDSLSALSLAGILLILINPYRIFRVGFMLSFAAVAGLAVMYPMMKKLLLFNSLKQHEKRSITERLKKSAAEGALVWLSVNAATVPIVLWNYSEFPVYSAAANVLLVPLTEFILLTGIAGAAIGSAFPSAGTIILRLPSLLIDLQEGAGEVLRKLPGSVWITGKPETVRLIIYYAGLAIILLIMKSILNTRQNQERKKFMERDEVNDPGTGTGNREKVIDDGKNSNRMITAALLTASVMMSLVFIRFPNSFSVTALDVGQGDSIVMTTDSGKAFMIDGGSSSVQDVCANVILPYLKSRGIACLEGIFITHNDSDHTNGIAALLEMSEDRQTAVKIRRVFMPFWMENEPGCSDLINAAKRAGAQVVWLKAGDSIRSAGVDMIVHSPDSENGFTGNEGSLVLGIRCSCFSGLFTGDLGGEAEDLLVEDIGHYSVLKAGHHGSAGSTSEAFLKAVDPDFCIFSAPRISSYGHPSAETVQRVENAGVPWIQTGLSGAVTIRIKGDSLIAEPYKIDCCRRPLRYAVTEALDNLFDS